MVNDSRDSRKIPNSEQKVSVKEHFGTTTEDICDFMKPVVRKNPNLIIVYSDKIDLTNSIKSFDNYNKMTVPASPK